MKTKTTGVFFIALFIFVYLMPESSKNTTISKDNNFYLMSWDEEFREDKLVEEIKRIGFSYPHIVYAQSILETGYFSSNIFIENNNLFGMKLPRVRSTFATGENRKHAVYPHWSKSLYDYRIFYNMYLSNKTEEEFFSYLDSTYAEDSLYVTKLQNIIARNDLKSRFD